MVLTPVGIVLAWNRLPSPTRWNPPFGGIALRPPAAWRSTGGPGDELPQGRGPLAVRGGRFRRPRRGADRPGRPSRLESKHLERIASAPRCSPSDFGLAADLWGGKTLSAFIARKWAIALGVRQCQRLFRRPVPISFLL